MDLIQKKCVACEGGMPPLNNAEAEILLEQVPGWTISDDGEKISREFQFKDFKESMAFVNKVAAIAESEGHHPDIHIFYNRVVIDLWTHAVNGLSENDFIVAAKISAL
jgi:4a-hydroxytetrahydrobiopterin dehydratase